MILKEVKPGKYVESKKALRDIKVKRFRHDVEKLVNAAYMPISDDEQFIQETRESVGKEGGADTVYYHDFSHVSEGAFKETVIRIPHALSRMIFLRRIDQLNRSLI